MLAAVLAATLATLLVPAASASSAAPDPRDDWYHLPPGCAGPARPDPQVPQGCRLTAWAWDRPTVVLWGDSHAWQQIPALIRAAKAERVNLTAFVMGKCPPAKVRIQKRYPGRCEQSNALALQYVRKMSRRKQPVQVILGSNWAGFRQVAQRILVNGEPPPPEYTAFDLRMIKLFHRRTEKLFPALLQTRARLAVVAQTATCLENAADAPYDCTMPRRKAILHETRTRRWLDGLTRRGPQIDVNRAFCGPVKCRGKVDGIFTYYDWLHLSETRSKTLAPLYVPLLRSLR